MPQIGWFELLIVVLVAILVIGPKDFPVVLKKIGNWIGSVRRYFGEIQRDVTNLHKTVEDEVSLEQKYSKKSTENKTDNKKDE